MAIWKNFELNRNWHENCSKSQVFVHKYKKIHKIQFFIEFVELGFYSIFTILSGNINFVQHNRNFCKNSGQTLYLHKKATPSLPFLHPITIIRPSSKKTMSSLYTVGKYCLQKETKVIYISRVILVTSKKDHIGGVQTSNTFCFSVNCMFY